VEGCAEDLIACRDVPSIEQTFEGCLWVLRGSLRRRASYVACFRFNCRPTLLQPFLESLGRICTHPGPGRFVGTDIGGEEADSCRCLSHL
jgi:hypothetical protein